MTIKIQHTHGTTETHDTLDAALDALREVYGDEIVTAGPMGWPVDSAADLRSGRGLVWQDEAASVDDDGVRAVASLSLGHDAEVRQ
jgi:hypothetical protein